MDTWTEHTQRCGRERFGITTPLLAELDGVALRTHRRRVRAEGWDVVAGVARLSPHVAAGPLSDLSGTLQVVPGAAIAGVAGLWRHQLADEPRRLEVAIRHDHSPPNPTPRRVWVRRRRWLDDDIIEIDRLATLRAHVLPLTLGELGLDPLRAHLIDLEHRSVGTMQRTLERLSEVGPVPGKHRLVALAASLVGAEFESIFDHEVRTTLARLGYQPSAGPVRLATPDGRGASPDIVLPWFIIIEIDGDRYHSAKKARSADRRKISQYAGLPHKPLVVDWDEWYGNRAHFLEGLDAAILGQVAAGVAEPVDLPPHLARRLTE